MNRIPGWRGRMGRMIDEVRRTPFDWASFECGVAFAARHVDHMLGTDIVSQYSGRFGDAAGAARLLRDAGVELLGDLVSRHLPEYLDEDGRPAPSMARAGDLAAIEAPAPFGHALGIVNGERVFVLREDGLGTVDFLTASRAWRVGDA